MKNHMGNPDNCHRCGGDLHIGSYKTWKMSWFTEEDLCRKCQEKEDEIKKALKERGDNPSSYEGCGYVPVISNPGRFIKE